MAVTLDTVGCERFSLTVRDVTSGAILDLPVEASPLGEDVLQKEAVPLGEKALEEEDGLQAWNNTAIAEAAEEAKSETEAPVKTVPLAATKDACSVLTEATAEGGASSPAVDVEPAVQGGGGQGGCRQSLGSTWRCNLMPSVAWGCPPAVGDDLAATLFVVMRASAAGAGGSFGPDPQQVGGPCWDR